MTKVLITGSSGMLGSNISLVLPSGMKAYGISRQEPAITKVWDKNFQLDICNFESLRQCYEEVRPDVVIHTAALTSIEECEKKPELAQRLHVDSTKVLADLCQQTGAYFVYISTDNFYDSPPGHPALESDTLKSHNIYAQTKFDGEKAALTYKKSLVLRVNIFGCRSHGPVSFGAWIYQGLKNQTPLTVFNDVFYSPISTFDLSDAIFAAVKAGATGVYNVGSHPVLSKYEFAVKVAEQMKSDTACLIPTKIADKGFAVRRPTNQSMNSNLFQNKTGWKLPTVDQTIQRWLKVMKELQLEPHN